MVRVMSLRMVISDAEEDSHPAVGMGIIYASVTGASEEAITGATQSLVPQLVQRCVEELTTQVEMRESVGGGIRVKGDTSKLDA